MGTKKAKRKRPNMQVYTTKQMREYFTEQGRLGGLAKNAKLTKAQRKQIGKQLAEARARARKRKGTQ